MIWYYPSSILIIYFTVYFPSIIHPEEMPPKFVGVSRVWNEVQYDLKGEHDYDPSVSPITSHGLCITKPNVVRVLYVISLAVSISFHPSAYMDKISSVVAHGCQNVSFYNHLGWSFMLLVWRTDSSSRYLFHPMLYHKRYHGVGFITCLSCFGGVLIAITVTPTSVPPCIK